MFNLRTKDHLRREAESFARMREAANELDERISAAMDRWAAQITAGLPDSWYKLPADCERERGEELGRAARRVMARYGVVL